MTSDNVFQLKDMYSAHVQAGLPDGRYVTAVAVPFEGGLFFRARAAWQVLTGRAYAFQWPMHGELEDCFKKESRS
jgi:hypothetical protein